MKRNVKFYRRDKSIKYRGHRLRNRDGKYKRKYRFAWEYGFLVFPYTGKERRTKEKNQLIMYLKTGNDECFSPVRDGDFYWD